MVIIYKFKKTRNNTGTHTHTYTYYRRVGVMCYIICKINTPLISLFRNYYKCTLGTRAHTCCFFII